MSFQKKEEMDTCNLCLARPVTLTDDHVPPYAVQKWKNLHIFQRFPETVLYLREQPPGLLMHSPRGVAFKTLCANCNNSVLGQSYDSALAELWNQVEPYAQLHNREHGLSLATIKTFPCRLGAVLRSILGHGLASNLITPDWPSANRIRSYILEPNDLLPSDVYIYYWFYRGTSLKIMNGFSFAFTQNLSQSAFIHVCLKFWPLAFWISSERFSALEQTPGIFLIRSSEDTKAYAESEFALDLQTQIHPDWPEGGKTKELEGIILLDTVKGVNILATTAVKAKSLARKIKQSRVN
ncbi:MAG: hypothetical protein AB7I41_23560 [Candidatus Sericytochromatia bacterium]